MSTNSGALSKSIKGYRRKRPEHKDHIWSYDIIEDKTYNGKRFRILNIMDEYIRECLLSYVSRRITSS